jgi:6-phosphogluconolactonase
VRRVAGELSPDAAASEYDFEIRRAMEHRTPAFDLTLLGMGPEGHTASLFPGSPALEERQRLAVHVQVPASPPDRVTMTPPSLASTRQILFLVTGADKADAVAAVFQANSDLPAAVVARLAPSRFLVDEAAASAVPSGL